MKMKFSTGDRVRCLVSGFEGVVIARTEYLNGCKQYAIKPPIDKDGKMIEAAWIDEPQLLLVEEGAVKIAGEERTRGGPASIAPRL